MKRLLPLLAIVVLLFSTAGITMGAGLLVGLPALALALIAFLLGGSLKSVSILVGILSAIVGFVLIVYLHQAGSLSMSLSIGVVLGSGILGFLYAWLLGLTMGKTSCIIDSSA